MKILALADIHGRLDNIHLLAPVAADCHVIAVAGDITDFGGPEQADAVLKALNGFMIPVVGVPGNCDSQAVDEKLRRLGGNIIENPVVVGDIVFVGFRYHHPSDELSLRILEKISTPGAIPTRMVLVTHQPAWGTDVDLQAATRHTGSRLVRSFIEDHQPLAAVSGHIHEACGVDQVGTTVLVNPGPYRNGRYGIIDINGDSVKASLHWL